MNIVDVEFLQRVRRFDEAALAEVYDTFSPAIYAYAMRLLGHEDLADECVAETFSRMLNALQRGGGPDQHLRAYLYRVAHNWITDCYRRQPPLPLELDDSLRSENQLLPESQVDSRQEQREVRLALRSLTPDQHPVITLRFIEGFEKDEVASVMEKPTGAIRALQFRALNTLRRLLLREEKESMYEHEK